LSNGWTDAGTIHIDRDIENVRRERYIMNRFISVFFFFLVSCSIPVRVLPTETPNATPLSTGTETPTTTSLRTATDTPIPLELSWKFQIQHFDTRSLVFNPSSSWLLIGSGDASRGNYLVSMWWPDQNQYYDLTHAAATVWEAAFSPDGKWAAYVVDNPTQSVRGFVVDVESKSQIASLTGRGTAYCLAFSSDGTILALGGLGEYPNGAIWIYSASDWGLIRELPVPGQNVLDLVFSPDGTRFYSAGTDGRIRIWKTDDGTLLDIFQKNQQANRIALSPEGSLLASIYCVNSNIYGCTEGGVVIWKAADGKIIIQFADVALSVAFSPDGSLLLTGGNYNDSLVRIRSTATWELIGEGATMAESLAFSPDGRLLATADYEMVTVWTIQ
jgi:WD40 repeat protein